MHALPTLAKEAAWFLQLTILSNAGTCNEGSGTCSCSLGYGGEACETLLGAQRNTQHSLSAR